MVGLSNRFEGTCPALTGASRFAVRPVDAILEAGERQSISTIDSPNAVAFTVATGWIVGLFYTGQSFIEVLR
jgi:hypothetical protein